MTGIAVPTAKGAFRDGPFQELKLKSGRWVGSSQLSGTPGIKDYQAEIRTRGPVFGDIECAYTFVGGARWRLRYRVIAEQPVVLVDEELNRISDRGWQVSLEGGFLPTHAIYRACISRLGDLARGCYFLKKISRRTDGRVIELQPWLNWSNDVNATSAALLQLGGKGYYVYDREERRYILAPSAPQPGPELDEEAADVEEPLLEEDEDKRPVRKEGPKASLNPEDDAVILAVGKAADWAREGERGARKAIHVVVSEGRVTLRLDMDGPARHWLMAAGSKAMSMLSDTELNQGQALRIKYLETSLDEVKDMTLSWSNARATDYPRLILNREQAQQLSTSEEKSKLHFYHLQGEMGALKEALFQTEDGRRHSAAIKAAMAQVRSAVNYFLQAGDPGTVRIAGENQAPHELAVYWLFNAAGAADYALASAELSAGQRKRLRAWLAFLVYRSRSPHIVCPEKGLSAFPNMTIYRYIGCGMIGLVISDHPAAASWAAEVEKKIKRDLDWLCGPNGGWQESPHYQLAAFDSFLWYGIAAERAGLSSILHDRRLKAAMLYLAKICTPPDPRFENLRHVPPFGDTCLMETSNLFALGAAAWRQSDPDVAAMLQWMWIEQGRPRWALIGGPAGSHWHAHFLYQEEFAPGPPAWQSEWFPRFGAVFRHAFPSKRETYFLLRQGPCLHHYHRDQGAFILWGKGRPLCLDWGRPGDIPRHQHSGIDRGQSGEVTAFVTQPWADYLQAVQAGVKRQFVFVKDADPVGPAYMLIRDDAKGLDPDDGPANWYVWLATDQPPRIEANALHVTGRDDVDLDLWLADELLAAMPRLTTQELKEELSPRAAPGGMAEEGLSPDEELADPKREEDLTSDEGQHQSTPFIRTEELTMTRGVLGHPRGRFTMGGTTRQRGLCLPLLPGEAVTVLLFPRLRTTERPKFTPLANGRGLRVEHHYGTDYIWLAQERFSYADQDASFAGTAGAIQVRGGVSRLTLCAPGLLRYRNHILESVKPESREFRQRR